jgi:hypothetical protein
LKSGNIGLNSYNEFIYFIFLVGVFYLLGKYLKKPIEKGVIFAISIVIVSFHLIVSFTATLFDLGEIWFPFIINISFDFPKPQHDYDISNLFLVLIVIYLFNIICVIFALFKLIKSFKSR